MLVDPFVQKYETLQRINKVVSEYQKAANSLRKKYKTRKTTMFEWGVWGSIISGIALEIVAISLNWRSLLWATIIFVLLIIGLITQRYTTFLIYLNVANDPSFNKLRPDKTRKLNLEIYRHPILLAYLARELNPILLTMSIEDRKKMSGEFLRYSERTKKKGTFAIAIIGLFLFAVWGAFLQGAIGLETTITGVISATIVFSLISIIFVVFTVYNRFNMDRVFLKISNDYQILAELLEE